MTAREYVRLYSALAISPKWGALSWEERGVWTSLLAYCGLRNEETLSIDEAAFYLRAKRPAVERVLEALVQAGWLDRLDDGRLSVHDWRDWQPVYRGPSDLPEEKARRERERYHRRKASGDNLRQPVNSAIEERRVEESRRDSRAGARGRISPESTNGSEPVLGIVPDHPRYPVAVLLGGRFRWRAVTDAQWERFSELVDNEYPSGTTKGRDPRDGWRWLADSLDALPKDAGDPIRAFLDQYNRELGERRAGP